MRQLSGRYAERGEGVSEPYICLRGQDGVELTACKDVTLCDNCVLAIREGHCIEVNSASQRAPVVGVDTNCIFESIKDKMLEYLRPLIMCSTFPVGSHYITREDTNPAEIIGCGVWERAFVGRSPVGVDPNDPDFNAAAKRGGTRNETLTTAQLSKHEHSISGGTEVTTSIEPNHVHSMSGLSVSTAPNHSHALSGTALGAGAHNHQMKVERTNQLGGGSWGVYGNYAGAHTDWATSGIGDHAHSIAGAATDAGTHSHTVTGNMAEAGGHSHTFNVSGKTNNAGGGEPHNNMHPYETVYFWVRVA